MYNYGFPCEPSVPVNSCGTNTPNGSENDTTRMAVILTRFFLLIRPLRANSVAPRVLFHHHTSHRIIVLIDYDPLSFTHSIGC